MIAVIVDVESKKINECFGVSSCLELPVFTEVLGKRTVRSLMFSMPERIYICSKRADFSKVGFGSNTEFVKELKDLYGEFWNRKQSYTCFVNSNVYFEPESDFFTSIDTSVCGVTVMKGKKGEKLAVVLKNSKICEMLDDGEIDICAFDFDDAETAFLDCYSKIIEKPDDYKEFITDILSEKTDIRLPETAQGVFSEGEMPHGYFVIVPPVYFGENVQIESGCVIGPNTAVMNNTLIAKNTNIRNSLICQNCFVSSGCFFDNVICSENVSVRRNSAVFSGSVLGRDCALDEESVIENGTYIRPFSKIDEFKKNYVNYKRESRQSPAGFYGYTPEKAALLGAAVGIVFDSPKIAVASDGNLNSTALKLSLMGGLITTGAECYDFGNTFLSSLHYFMSFCELDCAVFVSGNSNGTAVTVFRKNTYSLSNGDYHNIKNVMTSADIKRCNSENCKKIRQIHGMQRMYVQNLVKRFDSQPDIMPIFECENKRIQSVSEIAVSKVGFKSGKKRMVFKINQEGTKATAESKGEHFSHERILECVSYFTAKKDDETDNNAYLRKEEFRRLDAVALCFELLEVLHKNDMTLNDAVKLLPEFYVAESTFVSKVPMSALLTQINDKNSVSFDGGELFFSDGESEVRINRTTDGSLKIAAKAADYETACEIVGDLGEIIARY